MFLHTKEGGRDIQEGEDICIPLADSCSCLAETNTNLFFFNQHKSIKQLSFNLKNNKKIKNYLFNFNLILILIKSIKILNKI